MTETNTALVSRAQELEKQIDGALEWAAHSREEAERQFARLARYLAEFATGELWRPPGYHSLNHFLDTKAKAFGFSRSKIYGIKWVGSRLGAHLTDDEMQGLGISRLYLLARATPDGIAPDPELIRKAEGCKVEELAEEVRARRKLLEGEMTEDLEVVRVAPFFVTKQEKEHVDAVLDLGRRMTGNDNRNRVFIEMIDIAYNAWLDEEREQREAAAIPEPEMDEDWGATEASQALVVQEEVSE